MDVGWLASLATLVSGVIVPSTHHSVSDAHETLSCLDLLLQVPQSQHAAPCVVWQSGSAGALVSTAFSNLTASLSSEGFGRQVRTVRPQLQEASQQVPKAKMRKGFNKFLSGFTRWRVPDNMKGVGQTASAAEWFAVVISPPLLSWFIQFASQLDPIHEFAPMNSAGMLLPLSGAIFFSCCAGVCLSLRLFHPDFDPSNYHNLFLPPFIGDGGFAKKCVLVSFGVLSTACIIRFFRNAQIEFHRADFTRSPFLISLNMLIAILASAVIEHVPPIFGYFFHESDYLIRTFVQFALRFGMASWLPPGISIVLFWFEHNYRAWVCFWFWGDASEKPPTLATTYHYPMVALASVFTGLCCMNGYGRDKKIVAMTGFAVTYALRIGMYANQCLFEYPRPLMMIIPGFSLLVFAYFCTLFGRRQRVLPLELQKVKYLRIGYLRRMISERIPIKRCQELPDDAFGDITKASKVIIISHRWLDRYKCDVANSEYPAGFRLTTFFSRLEKYYPSSWSSFWASDPNILYATRALFSSLHYGQNDVLIFFDFMSVPQIGLNPDGTQIERTIDEQQIFEEALPAMGGLYTMYDVMVCPEVPEGVSAYESSGWCFCEVESAYLYHTLGTYSAEFEGALEGRRGNLIHGFVANDYLRSFEEELKTKIFFFDRDRDTVRGIVKGKIIGSLLIDAVEDQDVAKVEKMLKELSDLGLIREINSPANAQTQDSVLHLAVRLPSKRIVELLIEYGSDVDERNIAGDTPYQLYGIPRWWHAFT